MAIHWPHIISGLPVKLLSASRQYLAATTVGSYALFGGGIRSDNYNTLYSIVDAYDSSLTKTIPTQLSETRGHLAATTVGDYALFGGGLVYDSTGASAAVDAYDAHLVHTIANALNTSRAKLSATTVGGYALFGGGSTSTGKMATVDAYTVI